MNLFTPEQKVNMTLVGVDGNIFAVFRTFKRNAQRQGWSLEDIFKVIDEAKTGDYSKALCVIMDHCDDSGLDVE